MIVTDSTSGFTLEPRGFITPPEAPVADVICEQGDAQHFGLGLPRGFVAAGQNLPCDGSASAFVRGILLNTAQYNAMSPQERLDLQDPNVRPRWRLYGGPFQTRDLADDWDRYLFFYAFNNNQTWISHNPICIAPPWAVKWPGDSGFRWEWLWDTGDRIANRYWDPNQGKWIVQVV